MNARSRSLIKRFLDAPLPHQMRTPEQIEAYWKELGAEIGPVTETPR
ncbi:hypothetical protein QA634_35250 (plasmid) [Methylobacterium sp. CB376]|nr:MULTISPECIES: hypothetical protein [Methylobacterium]WFT83793.1 hypothetical protein QA634_35250 [Methylobacterium nodulans]